MKLVIAAAWACACACTPVYSSDIGVDGVPTDPGALAGRFALVTTLSDEAKTALGDQIGGGQTTYKADLVYQEGDDYELTVDPCKVVNFEVAGLASSITADTLKAIPAARATLSVDHGSGQLSGKTFRELWGIEDLKASEDMIDSANDSRIFDMEDDGHPGATLHTSGLVDGELYFVQRKIVSLAEGEKGVGVVTGPDSMLGLVDHEKQDFRIDATNALLMTETDRHQHPDPKESWFHFVRIADDADCGDVRDAIADKDLQLRPF